MSLIEKEEALKRVEDAPVLSPMSLMTKSYIYAGIKTMPDVNAVPVVHGRWEEQTVISNEEETHIDEWQSVRCSMCKRYLTTPFLYNFTNYDYCPHCGAKMDTEDVSE